MSSIDSGKLYLSKSTLQVVTYGWKVFYTSSLDGYSMYWNWGMIRSNVYDIDKKKEHFKLWSEKKKTTLSLYLNGLFHLITQRRKIIMDIIAN